MKIRSWPAWIIAGFTIYNIWLFWLDDWRVLGILGLLGLALVLWRGGGKVVLRSVGFVGFVWLCNLAWLDWTAAFVVASRLFLALCGTYLVAKSLTPMEIAQGFYYLFYPLKFFKVDLEELVLTITITLNFVPVLAREVTQIKRALEAKGFDWSLKNLLRRPQVLVLTYIDGLAHRADAVEKALRLKGYGE